MKLIKINTGHYVIVDDSEIKEGDWMIRDGEQPTLVTPNFWWDFGVPYKKITHSTEPLDKSLFFTDRVWGCERLSLGDVKELIGEVDVEKKAEELTKHLTFPNERKEGIIIGYNQALEDNKHKKYTRNEIYMLMCKAFEQGWKKADVVEAGLEGLETDVECAWILTSHDSTRTPTEWEVEFDSNGKLKLV